MKESFLTRDSLANKISYYHILLFMASLPFDRFYSHIILISFALHTIINFSKKPVKPIFKLRILTLLSVFFITIISTIYSINKPEAYNEWGKQLTILLFPLLFYFSTFNLKKYRPSLLLAFSLIGTAVVTYLYLDAFYTIRHYSLPFSAMFSAAFVNHNFSEPIGMHATFLSMQLTIALVYMVSVIINERSLFYKILYVICVCILSAGLIQLCSKAVFCCLLVVINFGVPYFLLHGTKRLKFMLITVSLSIAAMAGIFKLNTFKERYITELGTDLKEASAGEVSESRLTRWNVTGELIAKSPVIGYGAGSEIGLLHQAFFEKKYYSSFLHNLNSHNEYMSFMLKSGIIGLLLYLATLTIGFKKSLESKDLLFFTFILLIAFVSISENLLDVDKGIIFYAFFFSFFMFSANNNNEIINEHNAA
jgi:O-antigen ligase